MIILLTGPTGSGKTDTSWALLEITKDMVFLDCDWFASLIPFSWDTEANVEMVYQALNNMLNFYIKNGHINFVITLTSQMAALFYKYGYYLQADSMERYEFRLRCEESELSKRIIKRDRLPEQKKQELKNSLEQQSFFDKEFPNDSIFTIIDGTNLTEHEVASLIVQKIKLR